LALAWISVVRQVLVFAHHLGTTRIHDREQ